MAQNTALHPKMLCISPRDEAIDRAENDLVKIAQRGDSAAFELLVRRYQQKVLTIAYQIVSNPDDAQDIAQEVFIKLYRSIDKYKPKHLFSTWLYRLAVNTAIDFQRREKKSRHVRLDEVSCPASDRDLKLSLNLIIEGLTPKQRRAFVLRDMQGFPLDEVAQILKCNTITVRVHLHRARKHIRNKLEKDI